MKFKMSPNSLFAVLLRSPWWVSFALMGLFSLAAVALLPRDYARVLLAREDALAAGLSEEDTTHTMMEAAHG